MLKLARSASGGVQTDASTTYQKITAEQLAESSALSTLFLNSRLLIPTGVVYQLR